MITQEQAAQRVKDYENQRARKNAISCEESKVKFVDRVAMLIAAASGCGKRHVSLKQCDPEVQVMWWDQSCWFSILCDHADTVFKPLGFATKYIVGGLAVADSEYLTQEAYIVKWGEL